MEKAIEFHLEEFNGPLDLLLALVRKNKMSIYDIEIVVLIDQYLQVVDGADDTMDSTSEFITMAAWLVQLKSAMLLPKSDEADRMREELTGLLVEYSACKEVAGRLREMAAGVFVVARRPAQVQLDTTYTGRHQLAELVAAFGGMAQRGAARRAPRQEQFDQLVSAPQVSVMGRVIYLLRGLTTGAFQRLKEAFGACRSRSETVATFLALLELIRSGRVRIDGQEQLEVKRAAAKK